MNRTLNLSLVFLLLGLILGIFAKNFNIHQFDVLVSQFIQGNEPEWFYFLNFAVSFFDFVIVLIVLPLSFFLFLTGSKREAIFILLSAFSWFWVRGLKNFFANPCPTIDEVKLIFPFHGVEDLVNAVPMDKVYSSANFCYPSGHVFDYISVFGMIYFLRRKIFENQILIRILTWVPVFLISLVGFSRISLGAHFLTDVLGGYLLGFSWLAFLIYLYNRFIMNR